jgi:predicted transposase/invertase (TIGR01784 family)
VNVNSKYKNSVFSLLFSNHDALRELYCALEGVNLPPDTPIDINTLKDVLFMEQINDISFTVDNRLVVLIEHQSTINPNMPLRLLLYIARVYEKTIERKKMYQTRLEKIPAPEFIVLYNGVSPYPDHTVLRLSEAFKDVSGLKRGGPELELIVNVYNINKGHSEGIIGKSETLMGYSVFVDKVREYEEKGPLGEAITGAIKYCIENNILKVFLERHSTEVINMLITEWDTEEAKQVWYEEGREEGREEGLEEGLEKGLEQGLEKGLERGRENERIEIARNALAKGVPLELIKDITGLDMDTLRNMQKTV